MFHPKQPVLYLFLSFCFFFLTTLSTLAADLRYTLSMSEPHTHYFEVEVELSGARQNYIDYKMPVWAPGSYLVREFAKNVEGFNATDKSGKALRHEKVDKNTWRVYSNKTEAVRVRYKVYAYEMSVRTSFLDASHGYVNGTSIFMYPEGHQKQQGTLVVQPFKDWKTVSTGLNSTGNFTYTFPDYNILADSPLEIGNHEVLRFEAGGVPHEVAMYGEGNYQPERLLADMKKVVEECISLMGELPVDRYVFIVHNLHRGGGGLEHLNSTTLQTSRWNYGTEQGYTGFMALVAHEYFHLWNVKRLRPAPLGPFDYDKENYTRLLWVSEGITSYYDDLITQRAGLMRTERYLDVVAGSINSVENTPGNQVQTVAESSFDAWIKYYRRNENTNNAEVSYYTKGGVLGHLLNMEIMKNTKGDKSLDDVMRYMYDRYYKKLNRGFTEQEFKEALERFAGRKLDDFFRSYVHGTETPDYNRFFEAAGLRLVDQNEGVLNLNWGAGTVVENGRTIVKTVARGSSTWEGGLNVNDELIAIDGYRVESDISPLISGRTIGDKVSVTVVRDGKLLELQIPIVADKSVRYRFERVEKPTAVQQKIYTKWLKLQ
ncbi:M61 family metallopeptidase [Pontibacter lucknowensis]|uniref:Predicted metalloprotease, contains C-terminal PDZ domain n=1 Tax=Pontibacter lucknowensis TaxID=1077936 RepID=A0A1N6WHD8_9BACT|nr:PDZ domain-containing protein [Pontibacter lucknowensis]SIQ89432.1 Predicted metalloprotease, contains C-terminal PDZ domain [Pontibacter lucknowensis]